MSEQERQRFSEQQMWQHPKPRCPICGAVAEYVWIHNGNVADQTGWWEINDQRGMECPNRRNHPRPTT